MTTFRGQSLAELHELFAQELERLCRRHGQSHAIDTAARTLAVFYSGMSKGGMRLQGPSLCLPPDCDPE
uniref:Uncharacterized protein n=1 Tax=Ochrobactrum sp. LM19 TaxID=1449781 RepID=A0A0D5A124_9HYPH|nr:hypothetical protein [Ochrobactrum sp. LM19]AJW30015.1 hypothetical protein pLM19O2_p70 [Ochrobactrum sp. LM19]